MLSKSDLTAIRGIVKEEVGVVEKRLDEKITIFKDEILGEIEKSRDEMEITKGYGDQLEDHENRITKLEKKLPAAS